MRNVAILLIAASLNGVVFASQGAVTEDYSFTSDRQEFQDQFSNQIETDGLTLLVTARAEEQPGSEFNGAVYFYTLEEGRWVREFKWEGPEKLDAVTLIDEVAVSGDRAAMLTRRQVTPAIYRAVLHTFERVPGVGWRSDQDLSLPVIDGVQLPRDLNIEGNLITLRSRGRVISFRHDGVQWRRLPRFNLSLNFAASSIYFDSGIPDVLRDGVLYGYRIRNLPFGSDQPLEYFSFQLSGQQWSLRERIIIDEDVYPDATIGTPGGFDVDGNWFMLGIRARSFAPRTRVLIYHREDAGSPFRFHSTIQPSEYFPTSPIFGDYFGVSLDIRGERVVVGAHVSGGFSGRPIGRAFLFEYDDSTDTWLETKVMRSEESYEPFMDSNLGFGFRVGLTEHGVIVGDLSAEAPSGEQAGRAFIFENDFGEPLCVGTQANGGPMAQLSAGGSNALPDGAIRLTGTGLTPNRPYFVLASPHSANVPLPGGTGESFCIGAPRLDTGGMRQIDDGGGTLDVLGLDEAPWNAFAPGETVYFQLWYSVNAIVGQVTGLTNAVEVVLR